MTGRLPLGERRIRAGRFSLYIEPRDAWIGVFVAPTAVYVLPIPFVVFRWDRKAVTG